MGEQETKIPAKRPLRELHVRGGRSGRLRMLIDELNARSLGGNYRQEDFGKYFLDFLTDEDGASIFNSDVIGALGGNSVEEVQSRLAILSEKYKD